MFRVSCEHSRAVIDELALTELGASGVATRVEEDRGAHEESVYSAIPLRQIEYNRVDETSNGITVDIKKWRKRCHSGDSR